MDRISLANRTPPRENQGFPPIINPNFRRNTLKIKQREQRGHADQQKIKLPFQENYAGEEPKLTEEPEENQINLFGINEIDKIFSTK